MTTDSELQTLQEKVKRLTHDRDVAMKMAARSDEQVKALKAEVENYRQLWLGAEVFMQKAHNMANRKRTIHDWIWLGVWLTAAGGATYVIGWVLPGAFS